MEPSRADREAQQTLGTSPPFESALREALLRQEEAIAGFIRAAAQHLERVALDDAAPSPNAASPASKPATGPTAAMRAAALADAARMAEALAELQRLALQLARTIGARCDAAMPAAAPDDSRGIRRSPPDKAAPAWFAATRGSDARR